MHRSPFSFAHGLLERLPEPPVWLVHGMQHRLVLLLNHVLTQEPQAMDRLARQAGRVARVQWRGFHVALTATPAGLLDLAAPGRQADLRVELMQGSALALARDALQGRKPAVRIEGDVELASDIHWLAENVRWDVEDDLARLVGDVPAHAMAAAARRVLLALRGFVAGRRPAAAPVAGGDAAP